MNKFLMAMLALFALSGCAHKLGPHMRGFDGTAPAAAELCDTAALVVDELSRVDTGSAEYEVVSCTTYSDQTGRIIITGSDGETAVDITIIMAKVRGKWAIVDAAPVVRVVLDTLQFQWLTREAAHEPYGGREL